MNAININKEEQMYETLARVQNTIFQHPQYKRAFLEIEKVFEMKVRTGIPRNILCLGIPGTGKTTLKNQFQAKYPIHNQTDREVQQLVCVETPSKPTVKTMAETILLAINDPVFYRGSAMQKTQRIRTLFEEKQVKMVIIDELQQIVDHCTKRGAAEVSDWLKTLMEDTNVSFVLMGLPRSTSLLKINSQLKRRFTQRVKLPPFSIETAEETNVLASVIVQVDGVLDLPESIKISNELVKRFYYATNGIIDYLIKLMMRGFEICIETNHYHLSEKVLSKAFIDVIYEDCKLVNNPFLKNYNWVPLTGIGMPFYEDTEL